MRVASWRFLSLGHGATQGTWRIPLEQCRVEGGGAQGVYYIPVQDGQWVTSMSTKDDLAPTLAEGMQTAFGDRIVPHKGPKWDASEVVVLGAVLLLVVAALVALGIYFLVFRSR